MMLTLLYGPLHRWKYVELFSCHDVSRDANPDSSVKRVLICQTFEVWASPETFDGEDITEAYC